MDPCTMLETMVSVVATLGELAATVAKLDGDELLPETPRSLHSDLREFTKQLRHTLERRRVPSLNEALATLGVAPGATGADVRAMASAWEELMAALEESWMRLATKARDIREPWVVVATREATAEATRRRERAKAVLGLLEHLADKCERVATLVQELGWELQDTEYALEETNEASSDVPKALEAKVAKAEQLWVASDRLAMEYLRGALPDIRDILLSRSGYCLGLEVAARCQKADEDILDLLWGY